MLCRRSSFNFHFCSEGSRNFMCDLEKFVLDKSKEMISGKLESVLNIDSEMSQLLRLIRAIVVGSFLKAYEEKTQPLKFNS